MASQNLKQQINLHKLRSLVENIDPRIKEKRMDNVFMYKLSSRIVCVFNQYLDYSRIAFPCRSRKLTMQYIFDFSEKDSVDWNQIRELILSQLTD